MGFAAAFVLGLVRSAEVTAAGAADTTAAVQLAHLTTGAMFIGFLAVFSAITFCWEAAEGVLEIEATDIVLNAPFVKWSTGELSADATERTEYLGPGQLLSPPDAERMEVTFKLHECYPAVRYIVTDTDLAPMAEGMAVAHSAPLEGTSELGATGRTNVFMNGIEGPGPMGWRPSVFDTLAGDPEWSPWDHMTYTWAEGVEPRVLETETDIHAARDGGELEEFPGVPDTEGAIFVVNCPVPVLAENTIRPS